MTNGEVLDIFYRLYVLAMQLAGPFLLGAMAVGIVISVLQAATQIHEQTLSFVPKLVVIAIMLALMGEMILMRMQDLIVMIFDIIAS